MNRRKAAYMLYLLALTAILTFCGTVVMALTYYRPPWNGCLTAGNPISLDGLTKEEFATDFSVPVKYGMNLEVLRRYSSRANSFHADNSNGNSMLGPQWTLSYEHYLEYKPGDNEYILYLPDGNSYGFEYYSSGGYWKTDPDNFHAEPMKLYRTGGGVVPCKIQRRSGQELGFDSNYHLSYIEKDYDTPTQERLTLNYDANGRLHQVHAPSGDDRYLQFVYNTSNTDRVDKVSLHTSTTSYDVVTFGYFSWSGYKLYYAAMKDPNDWSNYSYVSYEYGSLTESGGNFTWTWTGLDYQLGKINTYTNGALQNKSAYQYHDTGGAPWQVYKAHRWDPTHNEWEVDYEFVRLNSIGKHESGFGENPSTLKMITDVNSWNQTEYILHEGPDHPANTYYEYSLGPAISKIKNQIQGTTNYAVLKEFTYLWSGDVFQRGRLSTIKNYFSDTYGDNGTTTVTYDSTYSLKYDRITYPEGNYVEFEYYTWADDSYEEGRLKSVSNGILTTTLGYNSSGQLVSVYTPGRGTTTLGYDSRGNVTTVTSPNGNVSTTTYNDFGLVKTIKNSQDIGTTTLKYSVNGDVATADEFYPPHLVSVTNGLNKTWDFDYTDYNKVSSITDPLSNSRNFTYNELRLLETAKVPLAGGGFITQTYRYDSDMDLIEYEDGEGRKTKYIYDHYDRITEERDHNNNLIYAYNYTGEQTCGCSGTGMQLVEKMTKGDLNDYIDYEYDLQGRLTGIDYTEDNATAGNATVAYNKNGQVTSVYDSRLPFTNKTYSYTYDGTYSRLDFITHPEGYKQEFYYNSYGQVEAYRDVNGGIADYSYNSYGQLSQLDDPLGGTTAWQYLTSSDFGSIGAPKKTTYANGAYSTYIYDSLGRLDTLNHYSSSSSRFDYIDLAYNDAGLISQRVRNSNITEIYTYDEAYRLVAELTKYYSTDYTKREYDYDDANNRVGMTHWNRYGVNKSTSYTYNNKNELVANTGYNVTGTTDPGGTSYDFDANGNMSYRQHADGTRWDYTWNIDDRMVGVQRTAGSILPGNSYALDLGYDIYGRRILQESPDGPYSRFFFSGLTEEISKVSVSGAHSETAFEFQTRYDAETAFPSNLARTWDSDRRSIVYQFPEWYDDYAAGGAHYWGSGWGWQIEGKRTMSVWLKTNNNQYEADLGIHLVTTNRRVVITYRANTSSTWMNDPNSAHIGVDGTAGDFDEGGWVRLERNLAADVAALWPGESIRAITGLHQWSNASNGQVMWMDDLQFSNSLTAEHNVIGSGAIGQIVRNRTVDTGTMAATDRYFHYDQVGSVMSTSNASGDYHSRRYADSFGNTLGSWANGLWNPVSMWGHNTKKFDADIGLTYMYQRWYLPETGTFTSRAPYTDPLEHKYTFAEQNPTMALDPLGRTIFVAVRPAEQGVGNHYYLHWPEAPEGQPRSCGRQEKWGHSKRNSDNSGGSSGGENDDEGYGDLGENEDPSDAELFPVEGSDGLEEEIMKDLKETANEDTWIPFVSDCKNKADESIKRSGLEPPDVPGRLRAPLDDQIGREAKKYIGGPVGDGIDAVAGSIGMVGDLIGFW